MRFKIVSVGGTCAQFIEWTLKSIENQTVDNWDVWMTYDPSNDGGAEVIRNWCAARPDDKRWNFTINANQQWAVRNQVESIQLLDPEDDDIIVFLDLDGDQFAHSDVLAHLAEYYADGTLLTYGAYRPVPQAGNPQPATPFPAHVVENNSYRKHILTVACCFNHLRTMKGRVFNNIPLNQFKWSAGWYQGGTDYIFMTAGLELAGGKYKCLDEVLCLYNNANPRADYLTRSKEASAATQNYLRREPLEPLS